MSTVELLKDKARTSNYIYLKVLQKYKFDSPQVHYVFEGYDDLSFYFNFLQHVSDDYVTHISLGKNQSVDLYEKIDWAKYDKKRIIIFIDRDYSRLLGEKIISDDNIYETTYYSIENYIPSPEILRRLINEILHFHEEQIIIGLQAKYEVEYLKYRILIQPLIGWILLVRSHKLRANLNQIDLSRLFDIDTSLNISCQKINKIEYLERVTGIHTPKVPFSVFKNWKTEINQLPNCKFYLRGKYELWFLITFFKEVNKYLRANHGHNSKVRTDINHMNAIEIIGPRIAMPARLGDFLKKIARF